MKYSKLQNIIIDEANSLKETAGFNGDRGDGGSETLLRSLKDFKQTLILKHDLRPSEYFKLDDIEVGEPAMFARIFEEYRISLAKDIKL